MLMCVALADEVNLLVYAVLLLLIILSRFVVVDSEKTDFC